MNLLKEFSMQDKCSYLANKTQSIHYKLIDNCSGQHCHELIERGFRRFGKIFFRPICPQCNECKSIKIDVQNYAFSKSARRVLKKGKEITTYIQKPRLTQEHLKIFELYHQYMHKKKGWEYKNITPEHYYQSFVDGDNSFGYEILYFYQEKLIAVDLIDMLQDGISSIYFFYNPYYSHFSLGKLSLYKQIQLAQQTHKQWIYLGYYVKDCPSLSYKAQYKPYLVLQGRPSLKEEYSWMK